MKEKWLPIPGHEPYEASNMGRIRRNIWARDNQCPQIMKTKTNKHGAVGVTLVTNGYTGTKYVARLVGATFMPDQFKTHLRAFYKDGDKTNCKPSNLKWVPRSQVTGAPYSKNKKQ